MKSKQQAQIKNLTGQMADLILVLDTRRVIAGKRGDKIELEIHKHDPDSDHALRLNDALERARNIEMFLVDRAKLVLDAIGLLEEYDDNLVNLRALAEGRKHYNNTD